MKIQWLVLNVKSISPLKEPPLMSSDCHKQPRNVRVKFCKLSRSGSKFKTVCKTERMLSLRALSNQTPFLKPTSIFVKFRAWALLVDQSLGNFFFKSVMIRVVFEKQVGFLNGESIIKCDCNMPFLAKKIVIVSSDLMFWLPVSLNVKSANDGIAQQTLFVFSQACAC